MPNRNAKQKLLAVMMCIPLLAGCTSGQVTAEVDSCGSGEYNGATVTIANNTNEVLLVQVSVGWFDSNGTQLQSGLAQETVPANTTALGKTILGPGTPYESCKVTKVLGL